MKKLILLIGIITLCINCFAQNTPAAKPVYDAELAKKLGVSVGDRLFVLPDNEMMSSQMRDLQVAGIFRSGLFEYDSAWIYLPFE